MIKVASCGLKRGVESLPNFISQRVKLIYLCMKLSVFAFDILMPFCHKCVHLVLVTGDRRKKGLMIPVCPFHTHNLLYQDIYECKI